MDWLRNSSGASRFSSTRLRYVFRYSMSSYPPPSRWSHTVPALAQAATPMFMQVLSRIRLHIPKLPWSSKRSKSPMVSIPSFCRYSRILPLASISERLAAEEAAESNGGIGSSDPTLFDRRVHDAA